jgi:hypothetical protein
LSELIACLASFLFAIAVLYAIQDTTGVQTNNPSFPLAELYYQATGSAGGTFGLLLIVVFSLTVCVIGTFLTVRAYFSVGGTSRAKHCE